MKLASKLPEDGGTDALYGPLVNDPHAQHLVVGYVDCSRLTTDMDTGDVIPTMRFTALERVADGSRPVVERAFQQAKARRTGQRALDVDTGEILDDGGDDG